MKKIKIIALLLALFTLCSLISGCAGKKNGSFDIPTRKPVDEEAKKFGNYEYLLYDDGTASIVYYDGTENRVTIPDSLDGHTVVEIGGAAFAENESIQSLTCNKSLEVIGDYAFYGCTSLYEISFNKKLWSVGLAAFETTPWLKAQTDEYVIIGDSVLLLYQGRAASVSIPAGVRHIASAFSMNEELIEVVMGDDVVSVGRCAFSYCASLRRVVFGRNTKLIGEGAFDNCEALRSVDIPDSVEIIGDYAFNFCYFLTDVRIGSSVREIGEYAFRNCLRLKTVVIPETVGRVGAYAFADCYSLTLVFYGGNAEKFSLIELDSSNYIFKDVDKIYLK